MAAPNNEPSEQEDLFVGGPMADPAIADPGTPDPEPEPEPDPEPAPSPLDRENAELKAQLHAERERLDRFLAQPTAPTLPSPTPSVPSPMPDPAADPEAFQRWLTEDQQRRDTALRAESERGRRELSEQQRAGQLRSEFVQEHPHLRDVLEYADVEFMRICPDGVIPQDTTALKRAIAQALEEKTGRRPATPPTRTGGVSGGSEARPRTKKPTEAEVKEGDGALTDWIKDVQSKSGLYG